MPTCAGTPIAGMGAAQIAALSPAYIGVNHPEDWTTELGADMRGRPRPLDAHQVRTIRGPQTIPVGDYWLFHSRGYDRGAQAYAPQFGILPINPIGAGIYAPYKGAPITGPAARYQFGAIFFDVQTIPTSMALNKGMTSQAANMLLAASSVGPSYKTTG